MEVLSFFGTEPHLLGLATIGGLLSFGFLAWKLAFALYSQRRLLFLGVHAQRRRNLLTRMSDFRTGRTRKRAGLSDLAISVPFIEPIIKRIFGILFGFLLFCLNATLAIIVKEPSVSVTAAVTMLIMMSYDVFRLTQALQRALWIVAAVNFPKHYRSSFLAEALMLRQRER